MKRFDRYDIDDVFSALGLARESQSGSAGLFLAGLGVGLITGCAAAMLLTPYRGPETREKLMRATNDLKDTVTTKVGELTQGLTGSTEPSINSAQPLSAGTYSTRS